MAATLNFHLLTAILFFGFLTFPCEQSEAFVESQSVPVRVRLSGFQQELHIEGFGFQIQGKANSIEKIAIPRRQTLTVFRDWMKGNPIWRVLRNDQIEIYTEKFLAIRGIEIRQGGKVLPNQIFLSASGKSVKSAKLSFDVIGILPLETYLVGVLSSEMPLSWPLETLKAQAIAARSYALATMRERSQQSYHLESSTLDQVFNHISPWAEESSLAGKAREAVEQTEGQVLVGPQNKILKAYFHSDCGGRTASPQNVWGAGVSSGITTDDSCPANPRAHWALQLSQEEFSLKLRRYLRRLDLPAVSEIMLIRPDVGSRVERVEVSLVGGEKIRLWAHELRAALGYERLRSAIFSVSKNEDQFQFVGQGFGHGVGLCQWGSRAMGKLGRSYAEILGHYYPRAQIRGAPRLTASSAPRNSQKPGPQIKSQWPERAVEDLKF